MRSEAFDFLSNLNTLWAIILGAVLATAGGLAAFFIEGWIERHRRERSAALFFGETLCTLQIILEFAADARGIGDPYGPVTMRMLRFARREIEIYERNRENLFWLNDVALRARIHTLVLRLTMPLEGIFDTSREISELEFRLKSLPQSDPAAREELARDIAQLRERRDEGFGFVMETTKLLKAPINALEPLAHQSFSTLVTVARQ